MSIFSKTGEYAMRAVFYIARRSFEGHKTGIKEVAENINSPEPFLAKILQKLSREGLVLSTKGPNGGFYFDEAGLQRPIADIIIALEGNSLFTGCALGLSYCSEETPCPLHEEFKVIREQLTRILKQTTIGQFNMALINEKVTLNK